MSILSSLTNLVFINPFLTPIPQEEQTKPFTPISMSGSNISAFKEADRQKNNINKYLIIVVITLDFLPLMIPVPSP